MDSFFKAAVCDLDQLLDEFELHTDELDCKSVYLKPPSYPYSSSLGSSQCYSSSSDDSTTVARNLPDLNALHYDSALRSSSSSNQHYHPPPTTTTTGSEEEEEEERRGGGGEVKGLTGVDLLSSVDRRPSPAAPPPPPPCPDRALKPLCDLVSDASSAMMVNNNNHHHGHAHDAFGELDVEERRMEEDGEEEELLVDFGSPVVTAAAMPGEEDGGGRLSLGGGVDNERTSGGLLGALLGGLDSLQPVGGYGASLSLLDVILPAAVERGGGESADGGSPPQNAVVAQSAEKEAEEEVDMTCMMTPQRAEPSSSSLDHCQRKSSVHFAADNNVRDDFTTVRHKEDERREQHDDDDEKPPATTTPPDPSASEAGGGLSCLSMCGALVNGRTPRDDDDDDDDERAQTAARQGGVDSSLAPSAPREESADTSSSKLLVNDATGSSGSSVVSTDGSVAAQQALIVSQSQNVAHSSRPADGGVSLAAEQQQQLRPEPPGAPAAAFDAVASSHRPSEPVPKNNPTSSSSSSQFVFDYLPESEQAELLVTDEELDAFLRAHSEAERRQQHGGEEDGGGGVFYQSGLGQWSQDEGFSEGFNGDLEERLVEEELKSCVKEEGRRKEEERGGGLEERDKTTSVVAVEGSFNPTLPSLSQEPEPVSSTGQSDTSGPTQNHGGFESHSSYGGARPKQTQAPRSPPMAGEEQTPGDSLKDPAPPPVAPPDEENGLSSSSPSNPGGPPPVEEGAPSSSSSSDGNKEPPCPPPAYCPQEHYEDSVAYDELSEPPPYHATGPPPGEEGGAGGTQEEEMEGLGCKQPNWVPDSEAPNCMNCWQRFTFTRRRHHCRACGKVYCAVCCNRKCKLKYLEKEARVCITCFDTIHRAQALERMMSPTSGPSPNPNIPSEYCSTIPPLQQARAAGTLNSPPPTVMVPVSVLKQPSSDSCPREQKRVWFADGILPNGEVADTTKLTLNTSRRSPQDADPHTSGSEGGAEDGLSSMPEACGAAEMVRPLVAGPWDFALLCGVGPSVRKTPSLLPDNEGEELPPLLITTGEEGPGDVLVEEGPAPCQILLLLEEGGPRPLTFVVNANLLVHVKLVTYCSRRCWCLVSCGLQALGQKELVFLLECLPEEKTLPKDLFTLYLSIYQDAQKGKFIEALGNVTFTSSFLGSKEHGGMLFFSPTCQPTEGLTLPPQPVLVGLLIQRLEVPWAKVFPLRLLLRLGAEHSVYPTTLVSIRFRRSVYRETGHTIMNLLADLRNYQYSLPAVEGLRIHMEMGHSYIDIPKSRFTEMLKVINSSNEHVISVGASFSLEADSHLVCFQNEEGNYQTQANSMPGKTRTVTGASFVVFNGALKASSGFIAKSSIVEDGLMVQIPPDTMEALRVALREQTDLHIPCGKNDGGEVRENVTVRWVDWTAPLNTGIKSGVDGRPLDTAHRVRLQQDAEFESEGRTIRCTEVFYELKDPECCLNTVLSSCSVFQSEMAIAACTALTPHLTVLAAGGINALCLRVSTQTDMVEYQAGWGGRLLPQRYMNELDSALIPVIHGGSASVPHTSMDMEFVFYITHTLTQI